MKPLSVIDWLRTGKLGGLAPGMSMDEVAAFLGGVRRDGPIWKFGHLELHFEREWLWMLYSDHFGRGPLKGTSVLPLDSGWFTGALTLVELRRHLNAEGLPFTEEPFKYEPETVVVRLASGVEFQVYEPVNVAFQGEINCVSGADHGLMQRVSRSGNR